MNLARLSVSRPIFTTMVTLIVVLLGCVSLARLRIDLLPDVELPTLTVRTNYEGASPETMEHLVTQIIEEIVGTVPGVDEMTSLSAEGVSTVRVTFAWGTDLDVAANDVRSRLEAEANELPEDITYPQIRKFDIANFPVVILGVGSNLDPVELTELMDLQVRHRFARIPGVAQVDLWGEYKREIRIEIGPKKIKAFNIPFNHVLSTIRNANLDLPAGSISDGTYEVSLRVPAEFQSLEQIRNTVVYKRDSVPITLGQIARVSDTYERLTRIVRVNGRLGLRVGIRKQADANTVEVSRRVLKEVERTNKDFPQISLAPVANQGNFIERSISNVALSVMYGGGLAILVLLFFLHSFRSTIIISLAIPISIIATFALVYFLGFTLNLMTLGGLALGVGMMVDSSIVVLENIFRRQKEEKENVENASINGTGEVASAIIASTITTLVIFLPLVFVRGVSGMLFRELAYVIVFSLTCSLLVALSIVPMLSFKLLRDKDEGGAAVSGLPARLSAFASTAFAGMDIMYRNLLIRVMRFRAVTILGALILLGASFLLFPYIGTEFIPPSDEGEVRVTGEMEIGTRLDLVDEQTRIMENLVIPEVPEAVCTVVSIGASGYRPDEASRGEIRISLTAAKERSRSNTEIANDLRKKLDGKIPGMNVRVRAPQGQFVLQRVFGNDEELTVEIRGFDIETLDALAKLVVEEIKDINGITDVKTSLKAGVPQETLEIDRDKTADLGLSPRDIAEALETAVAGRVAGEFRTEGDSHRILVRLENAEKLPLSEILDLTLVTPSGQEVALRNLVNVKSGRGPLLIDRKDQQRIVKVEANIYGRSLGAIARDVEEKINTIPRPLGYGVNISGKFEEQEKAFYELMISLILALVLVYMVLACQYESLRDPLVVILSVPFAAIGVLLILFFTDTTLNVQSYIGCIMLGGIVVNNAILLVDQAGTLRVSKGMSAKDAMVEAGRRRLRPILMTTMTTILGLFPLALGIGEGADAQAPLARAVIGGLVGSTMITLLFIPVVYSLFHYQKKC